MGSQQSVNEKITDDLKNELIEKKNCLAKSQELLSESVKREQIISNSNEVKNLKDSFATRLNSMQETLDNEKEKSLENFKKYKVELENKENITNKLESDLHELKNKNLEVELKKQLNEMNRKLIENEATNKIKINEYKTILVENDNRTKELMAAK